MAVEDRETVGDGNGCCREWWDFALTTVSVLIMSLCSGNGSFAIALISTILLVSVMSVVYAVEVVKALVGVCNVALFVVVEEVYSGDG